MIEHDRLPVVLDVVSYIFPTTYISDLFYQSFSGVSINYVDLLIDLVKHFCNTSV